MERFLELVKLKLQHEATDADACELEQILQRDKDLAVIHDELFEGWPQNKILNFAEAETAYKAHYPKWKRLNK